MSINVNFFDANENLTTFVANPGETFEQILNHEDVQAWFNESDADADADITDCISDINGADVEGNEDVINLLLRASAQDGDNITFTFTANTEDEDLDSVLNRSGNAAASGAEGVVIVSIAGGLQTARINITNGVTTVREAIYNDTVRARSGMTDSQLDGATVMYQGRLLSNNDMASIRLNDADIIELAPRVAATKG